MVINFVFYVKLILIELYYRKSIDGNLPVDGCGYLVCLL